MPENATITATCTCGKSFRVPEQYAGKRVKCTACGQPIAIPGRGGSAGSSSTGSPSTSGGPVSSCKCGAKFRLTPELSGKKVRCPKCQEVMQLPVLPASQAVVAAPVVAEPSVPGASPQQPNPWANTAPDSVWDELANGSNTRTETSLFDEPTAPKPTAELSSNEALGYVIRQLHNGHSAESIEFDLVQNKGMTQDNAERLVATLVPERAKAHKPRTAASSRRSGGSASASGGRRRSARATAADQSKRVTFSLCGALLLVGVLGQLFFPPVLLVAWIANMLLCSFGGLRILALAFEEDTMCGILWLFVPFYGLYYILDRWDDSFPYWLWGSAALSHFLYWGIFALIPTLG